MRAGLFATVPATPSTLEDYAGRNLGNGIDLPGIRRKRTVTVQVFVWYWYEGRREAANLGFRIVASRVSGALREEAMGLCAFAGDRISPGWQRRLPGSGFERFGFKE